MALAVVVGAGVKVLVAGARVGVAVMIQGVGVAVMIHGVGVAVMTHGVGVAVVSGGAPVRVGATVGVAVMLIPCTRHTIETRSPVACDWATIKTLGSPAQGISLGKIKPARKRPSSCTVATATAFSGIPP